MQTQGNTMIGCQIGNDAALPAATRPLGSTSPHLPRATSNESPSAAITPNNSITTSTPATPAAGQQSADRLAKDKPDQSHHHVSVEPSSLSLSISSSASTSSSASSSSTSTATTITTTTNHSSSSNNIITNNNNNNNAIPSSLSQNDIMMRCLVGNNKTTLPPVVSASSAQPTCPPCHPGHLTSSMSSSESPSAASSIPITTTNTTTTSSSTTSSSVAAATAAATATSSSSTQKKPRVRKKKSDSTPTTSQQPLNITLQSKPFGSNTSARADIKLRCSTSNKIVPMSGPQHQLGPPYQQIAPTSMNHNSNNTSTSPNVSPSIPSSPKKRVRKKKTDTEPTMSQQIDNPVPSKQSGSKSKSQSESRSRNLAANKTSLGSGMPSSGGDTSKTSTSSPKRQPRKKKTDPAPANEQPMRNPVLDNRLTGYANPKLGPLGSPLGMTMSGGPTGVAGVGVPMMAPLDLLATSSAGMPSMSTTPLIINTPSFQNSRLMPGMTTPNDGQQYHWANNRYFSPAVSPYPGYEQLSSSSLTRPSLSRLFTSSSAYPNTLPATTATVTSTPSAAVTPSPAMTMHNNNSSSGGGGSSNNNNNNNNNSVPPGYAASNYTPADDVTKAFEDLKEHAWNHLSKCILEQAQQFDIASLIGTLHALQSENEKLVNKVRDMTIKRDQLGIINARLDMPGPMLSQHLNNTSPNFSSIVSGVTNSPKSLLIPSPVSVMPNKQAYTNHLTPTTSLEHPAHCKR